MSTTQQRLLTAEEYLELPPFDRPTELVRGEIVELPRPNYRHGKVCNRIGRLLGNFVNEHDLGDVLNNDSGVVTERDPDTVRGPDVAFWPTERVPAEEHQEGYPPLPPAVAFEVLSPSNRPAGVAEKLEESFAAGVEAACVVDPAARTATIHRPGGRFRPFAADEPLAFAELPGWTPTPAELCGRIGQ